ncbi:hypothetical protein SteCoe_17841 [Stentor coeruleus]|uniref:Uncharacterized protein n=1 Tax=Stentor coeruleus TaxID=5963 RepID=A0A1R2BYA9_9CILI|nr:hypothetical protein SteCoe_17841 [Stentor coeruleus]
MVHFRESVPVEPGNHDERGTYEDIEERVHKQIYTEDKEFDEAYDKMYNDRKYPGKNNLKTIIFSCFMYTGLGLNFSYELYLRRASLFSYSSNILKLVFIPVFGLLTFRNIDIARDIVAFRKKYPEMYQDL